MGETSRLASSLPTPIIATPLVLFMPQLVDGKPEYSRQCLQTLIYSADMFAKSKIVDEGHGATDKHGLTSMEVSGRAYEYGGERQGLRVWR